MPVWLLILLVVGLFFAARRLGVSFAGVSDEQRKKWDEERRQRNQELDERDNEYYRSRDQYDPGSGWQAMQEDAEHARQRDEEYARGAAAALGEYDAWARGQQESHWRSQQEEAEMAYRRNQDMLASEADALDRQEANEMLSYRDPRLAAYEQEYGGRDMGNRDDEAWQAAGLEPQPFQYLPDDPYGADVSRYAEEDRRREELHQYYEEQRAAELERYHAMQADYHGDRERGYGYEASRYEPEPYDPYNRY